MKPSNTVFVTISGAVIKTATVFAPPSGISKFCGSTVNISDNSGLISMLTLRESLPVLTKLIFTRAVSVGYKFCSILVVSARTSSRNDGVILLKLFMVELSKLSICPSDTPLLLPLEPLLPVFVLSGGVVDLVGTFRIYALKWVTLSGM